MQISSPFERSQRRSPAFVLISLAALAGCSDALSHRARDAGEADRDSGQEEVLSADAGEPDGDTEAAPEPSAESEGGTSARTDGGGDGADARSDAADAGSASAPGSTSDAGNDASASDPSHADAGPSAAAPFGLDARPVNATCVAPAQALAQATLKASGCVDPNSPTRPAAGMIPYGVNSPLWSDGADKERFLALPEGAKIHINADGDWDLPVGSVLMKTFLLGGKRVETRLFMRHGDGWAGYSYQWNDAQTDAALLPDMATERTVGSQSWLFPSRKQCLECHTQGAGFSLGLETGQLNAEFTYPNGRRANQLATLEKIGLFDAPLPGAPATLVRFPVPNSAEGTAETRGKSYVHSNCAGCHRGDAGPGMIKFDMRYQTPLAMMNICNVASRKKEFGSVVFAPGNPSDSAMLGHMRSTTKMRMPPLATSVVDAVGSLAVENWVRAVAACP